MNKTFLNMTNEEVEYIVKLLFQTENKEDIVSICRHESAIAVEMESYEDGVVRTETDRFELTSNSIHPIDFIQYGIENINHRYRQFLLAKGYHYLLQDNEFMTIENSINLFKQHENVFDIYFHHNYTTGDIELNMEFKNKKEMWDIKDKTGIRTTDACACWE